ncbi:MAG: heme-binding protein [Asticcacaulis sp.]|uniref:GlcG/HbpS family heme-binding protein n=1 Tax=Asticcacaulis sp. TaxID=1872648 RepID=UPI0039E610C6
MPAGGFPVGPRPPDKLSRGPSIDLAVEMAQAAVKACAPQHIGVSIIDADGLPKLYYVTDGTAGSHAYTGFRKANAALHFKIATSEVHARAASDPKFAAEVQADPNMVSWAGGVPIKVGDEIIGAIGVSGAEPSEADEACAVKAIAQVQSRLK